MKEQLRIKLEQENELEKDTTRGEPREILSRR